MSQAAVIVEVPVHPARNWCGFSLVGACLVAFVTYLWVPPTMEDLDIWWHLRNAEVQLSTHRFLTHDLFSFTAAGAPWIDHEWLSELPFYFGWRMLGERGVYLVSLAAIQCILLGTYWLAYRKSRSVTAATFASLAGTALATVSFGPRTLLFGWVCLVAELIVLERASTDGRGLWLLPGLFLLWVNLHGSWLIGMVLLAIFTVCAHVRTPGDGITAMDWPASRLRSLRFTVMASVAALFINPYGWRLVAYPFDLAFRQKLNIATVDEWKTLDFHSPRGKVLLASLAILFVLQIARPRRWRLHELAFVVVGVYASFTYARFLFLAAILVMPIVAKQVSPTGPAQADASRSWVNLTLIAAMLACVGVREAAGRHAPSPETAYPRQATAFLQSFHPDGRVFNEYLWGGYLEWHVRQIPVFIDSRVDIFEYNGTFRDYLDVTRLHRSLEILDRYKIRYVLFEEQAPLSYLLAHSSGWKLDYHDGRTVLYERANP